MLKYVSGFITGGLVVWSVITTCTAIKLIDNTDAKIIAKDSETKYKEVK